MYQAGLAPEGRPVGVFLLLGPTGTGKTKTVEALADVLHGSEKNVLKVDCGEFQMEHEVAKLIGAPPGYLGHRETQPMLTQQKLNGGDQREVQPFAGAVRRNRESRALHDAPAAGRAGQGHPAPGRQLHGQFRAQPAVPHQQPGRARDDAGDQPRFRLPIGQRPGAQRSHQQAAEHRPGGRAQALLPGIRQPHRLHRHLPAVDRRIAGRHSRPPHHGPAESRQHPPGQPLVYARSAGRDAAVPAGERDQPGVRSARVEPDHPPHVDPAAGHAGGDQPGGARRARARETWPRAAGKLNIRSLDRQPPFPRRPIPPCCWWTTTATCCISWSG